MFKNKKQEKKDKELTKEEIQKMLNEKFPKRANKNIVKKTIEKITEKTEEEQQKTQQLQEEQSQIFATPEIAVGKGIDKLTTIEAIKMLTNIDKNDPQPMALLTEIATDYNYDWLLNYQLNLLQLLCGINAERAKMIVDVVRQPTINMNNSVTDKVRNWIRGDRY